MAAAQRSHPMDWLTMKLVAVAVLERLTAIIGVKDDSDWLGLDEAAEHLGVSLRTLARWRMDPDEGFPLTQIGDVLRVQRRDLDAWFRGRDQRGPKIETRRADEEEARRASFRRRYAEELRPRPRAARRARST